MINGIVNVYKEKGFTSFDAVAVMRGIFGTKKVGHTGTLDPDAEGVLPVCLGNATKLCDMLTDKRKEYVASFLLGKRTDTLDIWGTVLEECEVGVSKEELEAAIKSFIGGYDQVPPMYSAKKVEGKKLCDLARDGKVIERKPSFVEIFDIEILENNPPAATIKVTCGKGTYIRSLCADIGKKCGTFAVMTSLLRTRVSGFSLENAYKLSELKELKEKGLLESAVMPLDSVFSDIPKVQVTKEGERFLYNGNKMRADDFETLPENCKEIRVYDTSGEFKALYEYRAGEEIFAPKKMFLGV